VYWSRDSTKFACVDQDAVTGAARRLLVIDAASAVMTTVATGHFHSKVSFSPDSGRLAYVQMAGDSSPAGGTLKVMDLGTRATKSLRRHAAAPVWGPRAIAFSTVKAGGPTGSILNVAVVKPNGNGFRRLTHYHPKFIQSGLSPVAWSANGKRLLAALGGQDVFEAYAVDAKRGGARRIRAGVTPSALSRNGRYVIGGDNTESSDEAARSNVVRVPWGGGKAHVIMRHAASPSFNG
jgi:Tol biopolymer transport system component